MAARHAQSLEHTSMHDADIPVDQRTDGKWLSGLVVLHPQSRGQTYPVAMHAAAWLSCTHMFPPFSAVHQVPLRDTCLFCKHVLHLQQSRLACRTHAWACHRVLTCAAELCYNCMPVSCTCTVPQYVSGQGFVTVFWNDPCMCSGCSCFAWGRACHVQSLAYR